MPPVVGPQRVEEPGGEGAADVVGDERQQQDVGGQFLVARDADPARAGGGDAPGVTGLLQGAAQAVGGVDGGADADGEPSVAVQTPGEGARRKESRP